MVFLVPNGLIFKFSFKKKYPNVGQSYAKVYVIVIASSFYTIVESLFTCQPVCDLILQSEQIYNFWVHIFIWNDMLKHVKQTFEKSYPVVYIMYMGPAFMKKDTHLEKTTIKLLKWFKYATLCIQVSPFSPYKIHMVFPLHYLYYCPNLSCYPSTMYSNGLFESWK